MRYQTLLTIFFQKRTSRILRSHEISNTNNRRLLAGSVALTFFLLLVFIPFRAGAATLTLLPSSGSYSVEETFSVGVYIGSPNEATNGASGVLSFPTDRLEVASLGKAGSIFTLWVVEPSFSNTDGTINFEGIVLNPGFTGTSGKIITINFRVKAEGTAPLKFSSGSALANDGKGTNILTGFGDATFSLAGATPTEIIKEESTPAGTPPAPEIRSETHPDPTKWYPANIAKFTWELREGVTGARLLVGRNPNAIPTVTYSPAINSKELNTLGDDTWYFSVRLRNDEGWGAVSRFLFQIDSTPPKPFVLTFKEGKESDNPRPIINFLATDQLSGIEYYEARIDAKEVLRISTEELGEEGSYTLPLLSPGKHVIVISAFDRAGNKTESREEIITLPIEKPVIIEYPSLIKGGDHFIVRGTSLPNTKIELAFKSSEGTSLTSEATTNEEGAFTVNWSVKLKPGTYEVTAIATDSRGAKSLESEKVIVVVEKLFKLESVYLWTLAMVLVVALGVYFVVRGHTIRRKNTRTGTNSRDVEIHKVFDSLRNEIDRQIIKLLERKRGAGSLATEGKEESKALKQMKKSLDGAEHEIQKINENMNKRTK